MLLRVNRTPDRFRHIFKWVERRDLSFYQPSKKRAALTASLSGCVFREFLRPQTEIPKVVTVSKREVGDFLTTKTGDE